MLIFVFSKEKKESAQVQHVKHLLRLEKISQLDCAQVGSIYFLDGAVQEPQAQKIARELLCDPIIEQFHINAAPQNTHMVFADVRYKPGVTDAVGESVGKAIRDMNISSVRQTYSGARYVFKIKAQTKENIQQIIQNFAKQHLLNPLVQECKITQL